MANKPLTLKEKQDIYLGLLKELDRFCSENSIRYYLGCGTLLGAVRHKGFIPWDDDLDVFIPQPDYDRLCELYRSVDYELVTYKNNKAHQYSFGQLYDKRTYKTYNHRLDYYGCGIDLYVIYGAPSSEVKRKRHIKKVFRIIRPIKFLVKIRGWLIRHNLWPKKSMNSELINYCVSKLDSEFRKYPYSECDYIWPFGGGHLLLNKALYGEPVQLEFEGRPYPAPHYYHEVLAAGYGDYLQLPPEDKRKPYHGGDIFIK